MHIVTNRTQIARSARVHHQRFIAPAEQMTEEFILAIVARGVGAQQPFHASDQAALRRFQNQMKVVAHQTKCMHLKIRLLTCFAQGFEEEQTIGIASDDPLTMIAAAHDVIDSTRILDPKFASHPRKIDLSGELSILLTDPLPLPGSRVLNLTSMKNILVTLKNLITRPKEE